MYEQKEETFTDCRCPACKKPFDYVPISADACPFCKNAIDPPSVWHTRKYEGTLILPGWVRAFGWPMLFILAGLAEFLYGYYYAHYLEIKVPAALVSIGLIFFFFKLTNNGEH